jgi:hypothetical protein
MQKERMIINDRFAAVRDDGFGGRIISAYPGTKKVIEVCPGRQALFKIDGTNLNTANLKCIWTINWLGGTRQVVSEGRELFVLKFRPQEEQSNRLVLTCGLYEYRPNNSNIPHRWDWVLIDARSWKIRVMHYSAPVWHGNCYLEDCTDVGLMEGYNEITCSLKIGASIESLRCMEKLVEIGGDLCLLYNKNLKTFEGMENLSSLKGNLDIWQNQSLTDLTGLNKMRSVGGSIYIIGNRTLADLGGISGIESVGGDLNVYNNDSLTGLGMESLKRIGGSLWINYNPRLVTSHAEGLRDQVVSGEGIGCNIAIHNNRNGSML